MLENIQTYKSAHAEVKKLANAFLGVHILPNLSNFSCNTAPWPVL